MDARDIREWYKYNQWANARMLDAVANLTPEQFTRDLRNSFSSVRDTLVHMLSAEWIWLERWRGTSPEAMLDPADFSSLDAIGPRWAEVEKKQSEFVQKVSDEGLRRIVSYTNTTGESWSYPLGEMMYHVVNHASYHRGQVTTMLRQLGAAPAATDFLLLRDVT